MNSVFSFVGAYIQYIYACVCVYVGKMYVTMIIILYFWYLWYVWAFNATKHQHDTSSELVLDQRVVIRALSSMVPGYNCFFWSWCQVFVQHAIKSRKTDFFQISEIDGRAMGPLILKSWPVIYNVWSYFFHWCSPLCPLAFLYIYV